MSLCLSLSLVVWCCSCLWIFVHLFSTSGSLSSLANRLRLSGSGTTMALKCPLLVFQEFNAIPCKSHWNCPIGRATKTRFVWIYQQYVNICVVLSWFIIIFPIFSHEKMDRTVEWILHRRTTGCIPEPVPELEELSWTWPSQPLKDFFTAGKGPRTKWRLQLQWENMGRSSIYGI